MDSLSCPSVHCSLSFSKSTFQPVKALRSHALSLHAPCLPAHRWVGHWLSGKLVYFTNFFFLDVLKIYYFIFFGGHTVLRKTHNTVTLHSIRFAGCWMTATSISVILMSNTFIKFTLKEFIEDRHD